MIVCKHVTAPTVRTASHNQKSSQSVCYYVTQSSLIICHGNVVS